jgi:putative transposase
VGTHNQEEKTTMKKLRRKAPKGEGQVLQMPLSREERVALIQDGLNSLACQLGLMAAQELLQAEIQDLCGAMHERRPGRVASRWGSQGGTVVLGGRKVPLQRPRARLVNGGEALLETYRRLQSPEAMPENALRRMVRGVSCREYEGCLEPMARGFGTKRSSVSRGFVKASARRMKDLAERRFEGQEFVAVFIDGVPYGGEMLVVALGVLGGAQAGQKVILGLRQGATENAQVCTDLLTDLRERGLSFEDPMLFVLDGSKALAAAVKRLCGSQVQIQRCQQHKTRNVLGYLAEKYHDDIRGRMAEAYAEKDWEKGKAKLNALAAWLTRINKDAAGSLREGLEETLTVARLGLPQMLARSLVTTNPIESAFSVAGKVTSRVKRWRGGDMRQRWATAGLMRAESAFKRLKGYREIPLLQAALRRAVNDGVDFEQAVA